MKVLFATKNPAKLRRYYDKLQKEGIELISIKDINEDIKIEETGKDALENAKIKAKTYYDKTGIITIGMDDTLYIDNIPSEKQPGTHVRRVNGKELNDEEMIDYYTNLAKEFGGRLDARWVYGMVIYDGNTMHEHTWYKDGFYFSDKVCEKRNPGYPLDSITIWPEYNKFWLELSIEERNEINSKFFNDGVVDFIKESLKKQ